jgi:hypothetical protein
MLTSKSRERDPYQISSTALKLSKAVVFSAAVGPQENERSAKTIAEVQREASRDMQTLGALLGDADGDADGCTLGALLADGCALGALLGDADGPPVGSLLGILLGGAEGDANG